MPPRRVALVGKGPVTDAIRASLRSGSWRIGTPSRIWVLVEPTCREVEDMLAVAPGRALVVVTDAPVMQQCRMLELGAAYVVGPPVFPRVVLAVVRSCWRGLLRVEEVDAVPQD